MLNGSYSPRTPGPDRPQAAPIQSLHERQLLGNRNRAWTSKMWSLPNGSLSRVLAKTGLTATGPYETEIAFRFERHRSSARLRRWWKAERPFSDKCSGMLSPVKFERQPEMSPEGVQETRGYSLIAAGDTSVAGHCSQALLKARRMTYLSPRCERIWSSVNKDQTAKNRAAISGPMTNPFIPIIAIPPRVEISTT